MVNSSRCQKKKKYERKFFKNDKSAQPVNELIKQARSLHTHTKLQVKNIGL